MIRDKTCCLLVLALFLSSADLLFGGGSGLNVLVVVNQNSTNSVRVGNYYMLRRQVPPANYLRINWTGSPNEWSLSEFTNTLCNPLKSMLAARRITNQIDYVVLSMDIPYRVIQSAEPNGTPSCLYYGFKESTNAACELQSNSGSAYAGSEDPFRTAGPGTNRNFFLATTLTSSNLFSTEAIVDNGVLGDSTFPTQPVQLSLSSDTDRNVRYVEFDNTIFNCRIRGDNSVQWTTAFGPVQTNLFGFMAGSGYYYVLPNTFIPGSLADSLTSFGGNLFDGSGQTTLLAMLTNGAAASYGTVTEPCNYLEKFPTSDIYFYQLRGFSAAECYYMGITNPYEGIVAGEPLSAPFAVNGGATWSSPADNATISGSTPLALQFTAADAVHPLAQVDLFVDGYWQATLTNIAPKVNNVLTAVINGTSANYTVPSGATLASIASGVAVAVNNVSLLTKVSATAHGDRVELQSTDTSKTGSQVTASANSSGSGLTTYLSAIRPTFLDSIAAGNRTFDFSGVPAVGDVLQLTVTKTNGTQVIVATTNTVNGQTTLGFIQQFENAINSSPALQSPDGLSALNANIIDAPANTNVEFFLAAQSGGYAASQIQCAISSSSLDIVVTPITTGTLTENISDLRPRDHLYVTAGLTNLPVSNSFDTTQLPDGYHQLTAVAYEGSSVRTQTRVTKPVLVHNTSLSATLAVSPNVTNVALSAGLQFSVSSSGGVITNIQLFSTGGLLASAPNQNSTVFTVYGTNLDVGVHPFYALVYDSAGHQYRTATLYIAIGSPSPTSPFTIRVMQNPLTLAWPTVPGNAYAIQATANVLSPFQTVATVTATGTNAQWVVPGNSGSQQFYRVEVLP